MSRAGAAVPAARPGRAFAAVIVLVLQACAHAPLSSAGAATGRARLAPAHATVDAAAPAVPEPGDRTLSDASGFWELESSVAADPTDPAHFVVAHMSYARGRVIRVSNSVDHGRGWSQLSIPHPPDASFNADPVVAIGPDGVVHLAYIPVAMSGDERVGLGIEVTRSLDGGRSFAPARRISFNRDRDDKLAITVDADARSPFRGRVYLAWRWPGGGVYLSRSEDGGVTYTSPLRLAGDEVMGLSLKTQSDGTLLLAANRYAGSDPAILVYRSRNGGVGFEPARRVAGVRARYQVRVPAACDGTGALIQTSLAGTASGAVALAWNDHDPASPGDCSNACSTTTTCRSRAYLARSLDGGGTWSARQGVAPPDWATGDQFFGWLTDEGPDAGALWLLQRSSHESGRKSAHSWLLRSDDDGASWQVARRLSTATGSVGTDAWQGDYSGAAASAQAVVATWSDLRLGYPQVYAGALVAAADATPALDERFDGAWVMPGAEQQGVLIDIAPAQSLFFAAWFTYLPDGGAAAAPTWFALQGALDGARAAFSVYRSPAGAFLQGPASPLEIVGTGTVEVLDCNRLAFVHTGPGGLVVETELQRLLPRADCGATP